MLGCVLGGASLVNGKDEEYVGREMERSVGRKRSGASG